MNTSMKVFFLLLAIQSPLAASFALRPSTAATRGARSWAPLWRMSADSNVPTLTELSKDPFMKQVSHAAKIVELLTEGKKEDEEELRNLLVSQLGHSDGIRGFFVTYLTGDTPPADNPTVPLVLKEAMEQVDAKELVPLACMNVIMPTAMITMHQDAELSQQSKKTSERGTRVLAALKDNQLMKDNCQAILAAATGSEDAADPKLIEYWKDFFVKWGYKEAQKEDIAVAIDRVLEG